MYIVKSSYIKNAEGARYLRLITVTILKLRHGYNVVSSFGLIGVETKVDHNLVRTSMFYISSILIITKRPSKFFIFLKVLVPQTVIFRLLCDIFSKFLITDLWQITGLPNIFRPHLIQVHKIYKVFI